jgi:hypothetical protein
MSWKEGHEPFYREKSHADDYYRQKYEQQTKERQLFLGLLLGIAIGALWEVLRR